VGVIDELFGFEPQPYFCYSSLWPITAMDDVPVVPAQMPCRHHIVRNRNYTEYQADYPKQFCRRKFPETMLARRWLYPCYSEPFLALKKPVCFEKYEKPRSLNPCPTSSPT